MLDQTRIGDYLLSTHGSRRLIARVHPLGIALPVRCASM
jgi:hypothetical protein